MQTESATIKIRAIPSKVLAERVPFANACTTFAHDFGFGPGLEAVPKKAVAPSRLEDCRGGGSIKLVTSR